ncbi:MAG: flagellar biosynthesis protein FlgB [Caulobacteraceae bacterium]|jgi:flagellar basal-body rod protein FlgB|nr:flagellar biosynthesis protein FlgB [Caulobacteraceae bacterium]
MDLNGIPLFSLLQNKLGYLSERQRVIAQNVANSSTPGFTPKDLKAFSDQPGIKAGATTMRSASVAATQTDSAHLASAASDSAPPKPVAFLSVSAPDSETTLDGNQVVLEEQMMKMSEARSEYDAAVGFYQKAMGMLHTAIQKPGA